MDTVTKLSIKIGNAEFSAEGPAERVQAQYDAFLAALRSTPTAPVEPVPPTPGTTPDPAPGMPDDPAVIARVFTKDKNMTSLRVVPKAAADALVLLLYGYLILRSEDAVTGSALMAAAMKSGVQVQRIDRTLDTHAELLTSSGTRRGKRYGLNNRGIEYAKGLLAASLK